MKYGKIEIGESSFEEKFYGKTPPAPPTEPVVPVEEPVPPYMPPYYLTAYGIAVKNGFAGTETDWLESLKGETGAQGATGNGIASVTWTSGTHAPGTTDVYTITFTDGTSSTFSVYNGADGGGSGGLPAVTSADNGKFLCVVNGAWAAATVPIYNGATS